jgi:hypothetical protein
MMKIKPIHFVVDSFSMKSISLIIIPLLVLAPTLAYATSAFENGYTQGVADGKASARDSIDACNGYNSTSDINQCYNGYNLGFKKGCVGMMRYRDKNPEYPTCYSFHQSVHGWIPKP